MSLLERWRGEFGDAYISRNPPDEEMVALTARSLAPIWASMSPVPETILEVGANVGRNLHALRRFTTAELFAVEPNPNARRRLVEDVLDSEHARDGHASAIPFESDSMDLVFTSGVLIHLAEEELRPAYGEIFRVAKKWILALEYFNPVPQAVEYRGFSDMLFKRDYGALWMDWHDVEHVANGFLWKRTTGQDNVNWWLFRVR